MTGQRRRAPAGSVAAQELIEELAQSLHRSVAVTDPAISGIRWSRHFDDADPARLHSVLQGRVDRDVARHVLDQDVTRWPRPGFLQGRDDLGLLPRYCVPLRERGHFLGLLTVITPDGALTPEATETIARATPAVAGQLYADHVLADAEETGRRQLLLSLLGASPAAREDARHRLLEDALLPDAPHAVVSVVEVAHSRSSAGQVTTALCAALEELRPTRWADRAFAVTAHRAVLLQLADRPLDQDALREQSRSVRQALSARLGPSAVPVIGIGGHHNGLAGAHASHEQALVAVRAARRMPALRGTGSWEELGELSVLLQLPDHALNETLIPRPLRALLDSGGGHRLAQTLRCFLDHAGSTSRTAEALRIHRTSLHYRLRRIQEITGLDLDSGADRITLHLGLRIRELLGPGGESGESGDVPGGASGDVHDGARPERRIPPQRTHVPHGRAQAA
ncbi:PucR family transcriptional regulator [Kitasatospora sp. NPDC056783]|uniref:PucR family transcriptional regulator n=1 Tax=Kitasatospora sp. NPDC056783 TaxID=3345943 RepID=UPI003696BCE6